MKKKKLVILSGAGISAESGIPTFRATDGLWEGHNVLEVATPQGWEANQELVLDFYNKRRKRALQAQPNRAHKICAQLNEYFEVQVITQNVDNLHERGGSLNVLHLHGELFKSRSTIDPNLIYNIEGWELNLGDKCEKGSQLRPHIVWFGEAVPMMTPATEHSKTADIFIIIGTSLQVYPAADLINYVPESALKFIVDTKLPAIADRKNLFLIQDKATTGMQKVKEMLLERKAHL